MKFKEGLPKSTLEKICAELSNPKSGRFNGFCKLQNDSLIAAASSNETLTWTFQAFEVDSTVRSASDDCRSFAAASLTKTLPGRSKPSVWCVARSYADC